MAKELMIATGLKKRYKSREVVKGISVTVFEKEILAVIGPNGAGKSTAMEIILGIRKQDEGTVTYWTEDYKKRVGVQLQATSFFQGLSTLENLQLFAAFYGRKLTLGEGLQILRLCGLSEARKTEASRLSGGQQKRLAIAIAMVHNPDAVFLDEPTAALDPQSRRDIHQLIRDLHESGKTIVFTSHDMGEVAKLSERVIMIEEGRVLIEGPVQDLCDSHSAGSLEEVYLQLVRGEKQSGCI